MPNIKTNVARFKCDCSFHAGWKHVWGKLYLDLILSEICVCIFLDIRGCVFETVLKSTSSESNELLSLLLVMFRERAKLAPAIFLVQTPQRNCSVSRVNTRISKYGSLLVRNRKQGK